MSTFGAYAYCSCGSVDRFFEEGYDGQSRFGTAAFILLNHEEFCEGSGKVYPAWKDDDGEVTVMTRKSNARSVAVRTGSMYFG